MEIKIVTAFFDIGRGNFSKLSRSDDKYFEYFKFWAGLKNDLTVYCQSMNADRILEIRKKLGLEKRTHIKVIDNFQEIEYDMYQKMCNIAKNPKFHNFRYYNNALSNRADYDYIMCMKWWCLQDAAKNQAPETMMAWLDFGYNHGGERYCDSHDFEFEWDFDFSAKINMFCLSDPSKMLAIDSLQFQADCFIGHTAVMPAKLCKDYWGYIKESMYSLISLDCIDDDQQLMLMIYKRYPELFEIRLCDWFQDMEICSNQSFKIKNINTNKSIKQVIRGIICRIKERDTFINRTKSRKKFYMG